MRTRNGAQRHAWRVAATSCVALLALGTAEAQHDDPRCEEARTVAIPAGHRPNADEAVALAHCDAATLYYGIGVPADVVDARHCAYLEHDQGSDGLFAGAGILFLVYANAQGVARDVALARRFACAIDGAPAELAARLDHLEALVEEPEGAPPADACDFATSGYAMGFCAEHAASLARVERERRLARVRAGWDDATDAAYAKLRAAADRFIDARVEGEVDVSGSARGAFVVGTREDFEDAFLATLEAIERGERPHASASDERSTDAELNETYRRALAASAPVGEGDEAYAPLGTITSVGIRDAQRAWLPYRDAWAAFGAARAPEVPRHAWLAQVTRARIVALRELVDQGG